MDADSIIRWFDPNATYKNSLKGEGAFAQAKGKGRPGPPPVWLQYLLFSLGVFASPFIRQYRSTGGWPKVTSGFVLGSIAFALITGFVVFPRVADSLANPEADRFLRLSTIFTAGLGWEQLSGLPASFVAAPQSGPGQ